MTVTRVLTVRQPWADLILVGVKRVENRTRPVPATMGDLPVEVWLHAAKHHDQAAPFDAWRRRAEATGRPSARLGMVLGRATIIEQHHADDCATYLHETPLGGPAHYCTPWSQPDRWHLTIGATVELHDPVPARGQLGWWTPRPDLARLLDHAEGR